MQPIEFKHQNTVIAKDQPQYTPLPAYIADNPQGEVNCFISVSPEELEQIKNQGGFFFNMWCFNKPITPVRFQVECPIIDWQPLDDASDENLFKICMNGTVFSHEVGGKDAIVIVIKSVVHDVITINYMNVVSKEIVKQFVFDFKEFSAFFNKQSMQEQFPLKGWFYANYMKQMDQKESEKFDYTTATKQL